MVQRFDAVSIFEELPLIGERVVSTTDHIIFEVERITTAGTTRGLVPLAGSNIKRYPFRKIK